MVQSGETLQALALLERTDFKNDPFLLSLYAYCIARERGQHKRAISLCEKAMEREPENTFHYYILGRIYLLMSDKRTAIEVFRRGLTYGQDMNIISQLKALGIRKPPPIRFLKRSHPVNKYLGIVLSRLNLR